MATSDAKLSTDPRVSETSVMTLANCAAIGVGIVREISGTSISKTINNSPMTQEAVANLLLTRITTNLINRSARAAAGRIERI